MALSPTPIALGFLGASDRYNCRLPASVNAANAQYRSIVNYEGPREIIYVNSNEAADPSTDPTKTFQYNATAGGITVSVFRETEPPPALLAYWRMSGGYLMTWMEESQPDEPAPGRAGLDTVIANLSASLGGGLPRIQPQGPVLGGDLRDPNQRDVTSFFPSSTAEYPTAWPAVRFSHGSGVSESPPTVDDGEVIEDIQREDATPGLDAIEVSVTTAYGVGVALQGPPDQASALESLAVEVAQSLKPLVPASYVGDMDVWLSFNPTLEGLSPTGEGDFSRTGYVGGGGTGTCALVLPNALVPVQSTALTFDIGGTYATGDCSGLKVHGTLAATSANGRADFQTSFDLFTNVGGKAAGTLALDGQPMPEKPVALWRDVHGRPDGFGTCEENRGVRMLASFELPGAVVP